jgi:hypothetical protein
VPISLMGSTLDLLAGVIQRTGVVAESD